MKQAFASVTLLVCFARAALGFELALPAECRFGETCFVQQYVDHEAGSGAADYTCGSASYDGHTGTDIRTRDTSQRLAVRAVAAGKVKALRDGMADRLLRGPADIAAVKDRECGNGVVIDHGNGYETQYCHLRQGSVAVRVDDPVTPATVLGEVGYSGAAAFPHLELVLRKDGVVIDPFSAGGTQDCRADDVSLWSAAAQAQMTYANGNVLRMGWAEGPVELPDLETGALRDATPLAGWKAIVAYAWAINLRGGDKISLEIAGPEGFSTRNEIVLDRNKAQYFLFSGKSLKAAQWPVGDYVQRFRVERDGAVVIDRELKAEVR